MSKINGGLALIDLSGKYNTTSEKYVDAVAHEKVLKGKGKKLFVVYTDLGVYACGCDGVEKTDSNSKKYYELVCGDKSFKVYADEILFGDSDAIAEIKASIPESN